MQFCFLSLCVFILFSFSEAKGATDDESIDNGIYDVLELSPDATVDEIKRAWRSLRQQIHPDKLPDDPNATKRYQKMQEAVEELIARRESMGPQIFHGDVSEGLQVDPNPENTFEGMILQVVSLSEQKARRWNRWTNYLEKEHPKTERRILGQFEDIFRMGGVNLSVQNSRGETVLHQVIAPFNADFSYCQPPEFFSYFRAAKWLVQRDAKVNMQDGDGNSPVHRVFKMPPTYWGVRGQTDYAIQNDKRALKMLRILSSGPEKLNLRLENKRGETPLDMALDKGYWRVVHWMIGQIGSHNLSS